MAFAADSNAIYVLICDNFPTLTLDLIVINSQRYNLHHGRTMDDITPIER